MKSIMFLMETVQRCQFRCNYLRNKKLSLSFSLHFWNLAQILNILNKNMTLTGFVFPKLQTLKTWWDKCLKNPVSEDPSPCDRVNVPKHYWNLHHSTFIIFIGHSQGNYVSKSLSCWHAKSWDCLLTHWLPMKSILFFIGTIQEYQFRCNCLRNTKLVLSFLLHFLNVD